jgi:hypothetical protein
VALIPVASLAGGTLYTTVPLVSSANPTGAQILAPAAGEVAYIYTHGTTTQIDLWSAESGGSIIDQPVTSGAEGNVPGWIDTDDLPADLVVGGVVHELAASTSGIVVPSPTTNGVAIYGGSGWSSLLIGSASPSAALSVKGDFGINESMSSGALSTALQNAFNAAISAGRTLSLDFLNLGVDEPMSIGGPLHLIGPSVLANWGPGGSANPEWLYPQGTPNPFVGGVITQLESGADILQYPANGELALEHLALVFGTPYVNTGNGLTQLPPAIDGAYDFGMMDGRVNGVRVFGPDGNHYGFSLMNHCYGKWDHVRTFGGGGIHYQVNCNESQIGNCQWTDIISMLYIGGTAHCNHWDNQSGQTGSAAPGFQGMTRFQNLVAIPSVQPAGTVAPTNAQYIRRFTGEFATIIWPEEDQEGPVGFIADVPTGPGNRVPGFKSMSAVSTSGATYTSSRGGMQNIVLPFTMNPLPAGEYLYVGTFGNGMATMYNDGTHENTSFMPIGTSGRVYGVATDASYLYWTQDSGNLIGRSNLDGSSPSTSFITTGSAPWGICVNGTSIFWCNSGANTIGTSTLAGGSVNNSFITGCSTPRGICCDGTYIYWCNEGTGDIGRALLNGTSVNQAFITGGNQPTGIAVNASNLFWTNYAGSEIGTATVAGGSVNQAFITGMTQPQDVCLDATYIYWVSYNGAEVGRALLAGTGANDSFDTGITGPVAICTGALPADAHVWAEVGANGGTLAPAGEWSVPAGQPAGQVLTCHLLIPSGGQYQYTWRNAVPGTANFVSLDPVGVTW